MDKTQIEMLRHTVGADSGTPGYRNHYCTQTEDKNALALVEMGLFEGPKYIGESMPPNYGVFFATEKAFQLLGIKEKNE